MQSLALHHRRGNRTSRHVAIALAAGLLAGACGKQPKAPRGPLEPGLSTRRLELSIASDKPAPAPERKYFFEPAKELAVWSAARASVTVEPVRLDAAGAKVDAAMVTLPGFKTYTRRGSLDLRHVNEVDVHVLASSEAWLTISFWQHGKCIAKTRDVLCPAQPTAFHVVEPLLWPLPEQGDCEAVAIELNGSAERLAVISVALNDRAPSSYADPEGKVDQVFAFGGDTRLGRWVTARRSLGANVDLQPGSALVFGYLQPRRVRRHGAEAELVVQVEASDGERIERKLSLEGDGDDPSAWHRARIDLGELGAGPTRIVFSMDAAGGDSACFLSNPALVEHTPTLRPSVLLVTSDTHRADCVAASGAGGGIATPVIDALAARGVYFTNCYSAVNSTNPSHVSLMTGVHPRDTGIPDNATPLKDTAPTLAQAFRALGYRTFGAVSVRHLTPPHSGLGQGFDVFSSPFPEDERSAHDTVAAALELLEKIGDEPVFMWVHVFDAHAPYTPPQACDREYYEPKQRDPFDVTLPDPGIAPEKLAPELKGLRDLEFPKAQYKAEVTCLDTQLGALFDAPRFRGGVTAFVADHGESLGEHGIYFDHAGLFPQTVHVPLALAWPGCPAGKRDDARVMSLDLGHTLLLLAGGDKADMPGRNLLDTLDVGSSPERSHEPRFLLSGSWSSAAIEDGQYFLTLILRDPLDPRLEMQKEPHQVFMYDLEHDPDCNRDISQEQFAKAKQLRAQLIAWLNKRRSLDWAGGRLNDPAFLAQLKQLGYVHVERPADEPLWVPDDCATCKRFE